MLITVSTPLISRADNGTRHFILIDFFFLNVTEVNSENDINCTCTNIFSKEKIYFSNQL